MSYYGFRVQIEHTLGASAAKALDGINVCSAHNRFLSNVVAKNKTIAETWIWPWPWKQSPQRAATSSLDRPRSAPTSHR